MDANILEALKKQGKNGFLDNLILFGRVRCAIKRPTELLGKSLATTDTGAFAILDVYAVKCQGEDYFLPNDTVSPCSVYFTKGSMIIYINSQEWVGKDVKVYGSSTRRGTKVRQQFGHKSAYDGISALAFARQGNSFVVVPNAMIELGEHDPDARLTPLEDFMIKLKAEKSDIIEYPVSLKSIIPYSGVEEYEVLENVSSTSDTFVKEDKRLDLSKIDLHLTYHLQGKQVSGIIDDVREEIQEMQNKKRKYKDSLSKELKSLYDKNSDKLEDILVLIRRSFCKNIAINYTSNVGTSLIKGRAYMERVINNLVGNPVGFDPTADDKVPTQVLRQSADWVLQQALIDPMVLMGTPLPEDMRLPMFNDIVQFDVAVISATTGIDIDKFKTNYHSVSKTISIDTDAWMYCLLYYPYVLGMVGTGLSMADLDTIYLSYSIHMAHTPIQKENGDMRGYILMLNTINEASDTDTIISASEIRRADPAYPSKGKRFLKQNFFPTKKDTVEVLSAMCGVGVANEKTADYMVRFRPYSKQRIDALIEQGVLDTIDDDYILTKELEKEFLIYDTLIYKGLEPTGISDSQVQSTIVNFENRVGFRLEDLQKDGIKLCKYKAGVLSGCAGSGKTTTSECLTDCLRAYKKGYEIVYSTPTGKACRRLAEVVHGTVKTINAQFGVGMAGDSYLQDIKARYIPTETKKIYILDEMAMANSNLVYEVVRNLGKDDLIYFLGDIKQLPPIGKGMPFAVLMAILPCVELGVSKRAAEGSLINYNTTLVNNMSSGVVHELLYDDSSYICRECKDTEIPNVALKIWQEFMQGSVNGKAYTEDDIQVITGYATPTKTFSTAVVNPILQQYLRRNDRLLFKHGDRDFYKNDRVIHVNANSYSMQRYVQVDENTYKGVVTFGVMNGEVGTLVDILRSDMVNLIPYKEADLKEPLYEDVDDLQRLVEAREAREDLRDESLYKDSNYYFVKVKFYDVDLGRDVYAMYVARAYMQEEFFALSGADLNNLDLAYALTTHKMQGSQSPVVILLFGSQCSPYFINRNMLNTMITRSQEVVVSVGSVLGAESPINKGRLVASPVKTKSLLTLMSET